MGRVISKPEPKHECSPGWEWKPVTQPDDFGMSGYSYGIPPHSSDFPKGTIWQCDCSHTWEDV